ncbi:MAG: ABC transporter permease subunit [Planctomycetota bacterium]
MSSAEQSGKATADGSPSERATLIGSSRRMRVDRWFQRWCIFIAVVSVVILGCLLVTILVQGSSSINSTLIFGTPEPDAREAGMWPAITGTIWICAICAFISLPLGIGTAVLLEEFKPRSRFALYVYQLIQLNISNLAGVPSVVYGILGLTAFVSMFSLFQNADDPGAPAFEVGAVYYDQFANLASDPFLSTGGDDVIERYFVVPVANRTEPPTVPTPGMKAFEYTDEGMVPAEVTVVDPFDAPTDPEALSYAIDINAVPGRISDKSWYYFQLPFGRGVLAGALTLMLVILPVVIISSQESLRAVPGSLRDGALGLGATPWQVVWNVTLPASIPGIMTGSILAMSRAIGETAPILIICGIVYIRNSPQHLMDSYTVMPLQIYNWSSLPQSEVPESDFHSIAAGGIILLLAILLTFNAFAVLIRQRMHNKLS